MNTWIVSSIITNRTNNCYSEHSIVSLISPTSDSCDWQDWGHTPTTRGRHCRMFRKGQEESRTGEKRTKTHRTHKSIWINKSSVNPKSTSNQSSKPCTVLQYPSRKEQAQPEILKEKVLFGANPWNSGWLQVGNRGSGAKAPLLAVRPKLRITGLFFAQIPRADPLTSLHNFHRRTFVSRFGAFWDRLSIRMTQQNCNKKFRF